MLAAVALAAGCGPSHVDAPPDPCEVLESRLKEIILSEVDLTRVPLPEAARRLEEDVRTHWTNGPPPRIVVNPEIHRGRFINHVAGHEREVELLKQAMASRSSPPDPTPMADRQVVLQVSRISAMDALRYVSDACNVSLRVHEDWIEINPPGRGIEIAAYSYPSFVGEMYQAPGTNFGRMFDCGWRNPVNAILTDSNELFIAVTEGQLSWHLSLLGDLVRTNGVPVKPAPLYRP